jgi:hypothetical protein
MPPLWQYFLLLENELFAATQAGKTYFGPQTLVDDTVARQACVHGHARRSLVGGAVERHSFNYLLRVLR